MHDRFKLPDDAVPLSDTGFFCVADWEIHKHNPRVYSWMRDTVSFRMVASNRPTSYVHTATVTLPRSPRERCEMRWEGFASQMTHSHARAASEVMYYASQF